MPETVVQVPERMLDLLISGFIQENAHRELRERKRSGSHQTTLKYLHPGDPMGALVAWLWRSAQPTSDQSCAKWVSAYLAELRFHGEGADSSIDLEAVLAGLVQALPSSFGDGERVRLFDYLRINVPLY